MNIHIRNFKNEDINAAINIWNEVVRDGIAFPQTEPLDEVTGLEFFREQSFTGIAYAVDNNDCGSALDDFDDSDSCSDATFSSVSGPTNSCDRSDSDASIPSNLNYSESPYSDYSEKIVGLYILHPNNVGRCGHICNASYAVRSDVRGQHVGEKLVAHCIKKGRELGFRILQFNAVVANNYAALHLYEKLGFVKLGTIPDGFLTKDGTYQDIIPHYLTLS